MQNGKMPSREPKLYDDILWPPLIPGNVKDQLEDVRNMEIRSDDIIISTYPRSGTHWMGEIVTMLVTGSAELPHEDNAMRGIIDFNAVSTFKDQKSPRFMLTHLPCKYRPRDLQKARVIYVARNPKDVAVSMHCVQKNSKVTDYHNDWNRFLQDYLSGQCLLGTWFDNVIPWMNLSRESKNILVVKYEDLKRNLKEGITEIAEFIGANCDEKLIDEITDALDFKAVKVKRDTNMSEKTKAMSKTGDNFFYRKGQVADWKNWFTVAQNEQFDQIYEEKMKDTGLTFDFVI